MKPSAARFATCLVVCLSGGATAALAVGGCQRGGTTDVPTDDGAVATADPLADAPSSAELADALDPGAVEPLSSLLPPWLAASFVDQAQLDDPGPALKDAQQQMERSFERVSEGSDNALVAGLPVVGRAAVLAERLASDPQTTDAEVLLLLERIYRMLDAPWVLHNRQFAQRLLSGLAALGGSGEGALDVGQLQQLGQLMFEAVERAHALHHRTLATLLRRMPDDPALASALADSAEAIYSRDRTLAMGLMQRSLVLRGDTATGEHWIALAELCHRSLETECAEAARARAERAAAGLTPAQRAKAFKDERALAAAAERVSKLRSSEGLDDSLALARAWSDLERPEQALAVYQELTERHPEDARPWVGLVDQGLAINLDYVAAFEVLDKARPTENLGASWYEMSIGVRAIALAYYIVPQLAGRSPEEIFESLSPMLSQMDRDIDALVALGSDDGAFVRFLYDNAMEAWPSVATGQSMIPRARGLLERAQQLYRTIPDSAYAYTLMLAAAEFSADREQALAVLDAPAPSGDADELAVRRLRAAIDLIATWDASERADLLVRAAAAVEATTSSFAHRRLAIDARMIAHQLGNSQDLPTLEQGYRAVVEHEGASGLLLNNLGVVVALQGRPEDAATLWSQAATLAEPSDRPIPLINKAVAPLFVAGPLPGEEVFATLAAISEQEGDNDVGLLAHTWQAAVTSGPALDKARKALDAAVEAASKEALRPRWASRSGVVLRGSVQLGVGYSSKAGMDVQIDTTGIPWLVMPPPIEVARTSKP